MLNLWKSMVCVLFITLDSSWKPLMQESANKSICLLLFFVYNTLLFYYITCLLKTSIYLNMVPFSAVIGYALSIWSLICNTCIWFSIIQQSSMWDHSSCLVYTLAHSSVRILYIQMHACMHAHTCPLTQPRSLSLFLYIIMHMHIYMLMGVKGLYLLVVTPWARSHLRQCYHCQQME